MAKESLADVLERLFAAYEHKHRLPVIEEVVACSREELAGQGAGEASLERLERLARQRLDSRPSSRS